MLYLHHFILQLACIKMVSKMWRSDVIVIKPGALFMHINVLCNYVLSLPVCVLSVQDTAI